MTRRRGKSDSVVPGGLRAPAVRLKRAGKFTMSQQLWLTRQLNDPYVAAAKQKGYRSRAAFKLLQMDEKYHLLRTGARVVDLGAAPGGWSQMAAKKVGKDGLVVAIDLLEMEPLAGVIFVQGDFTDADAPARLRALLKGKADLVLSDMAASTTGHTATDHLRIVALAEMALQFALEELAEGGAFVVKLFQGGAQKGLLDQLKTHFAKVAHVKPPASRKDSSELYIVATGFRAAKPRKG